jgi:hypothetical protein
MRPRPENRVVRARAAAVNSLFPRVESSSCVAVRKPTGAKIAGRKTMNNNEEQ